MRSQANHKTQALLFYSLFLSVCLSTSVLSDEAVYASTTPNIDGIADEPSWQHASWYGIDVPTIGGMPDKADFNGRYKLTWDHKALYLLAEIQDDVLFDQHADPLVGYWSDDCLEIFIDEDQSGGDHLNNYNAFAYHIALDNQAVDIGPDGKGGGMPLLLNNHIESAWKRSTTPPHIIQWEVKINVYPDSFHHQKPGVPVKLTANKTLGFMLSYCDNDGSPSREHFIGSHPIEAVNGDMNRGYIDASVFDTLVLAK
jgi:hypothetical protein